MCKMYAESQDSDLHFNINRDTSPCLPPSVRVNDLKCHWQHDVCEAFISHKVLISTILYPASFDSPLSSPVLVVVVNFVYDHTLTHEKVSLNWHIYSYLPR